MDRPDGMVELAPRVPGDGRLQLDEPFLQPASRREAATEPVAGQCAVRAPRENLLVHLLGFLEQTERPQCIGVQRPILGIDRVEAVEEVGLLLRTNARTRRCATAT